MPGRSPRLATVVAAATILASLGTVGAVAAVFQHRAAVDRPDAAAWFDRDPAWIEALDASGARIGVASRTSAFGPEPTAALDTFSSGAVRGLLADAGRSELWTSSVQVAYANGNYIGFGDMYVATDDGVAQVRGYAAFPLTLTFSPPIRVLPDDPEVGDTLSDEGTASLGGLDVTSYTYETQVETVDDDCVTMSSTLAFTPTTDGAGFGATAETQAVTATYCEGEWVVDSSSDTGSSKPITAAEARKGLDEYATTTSVSLPPSVEPEKLLLAREFGSGAASDLTGLPDDGLVVDTDEGSNTVRALVAADQFLAPIWSLTGNAPTIAAPVLAGEVLVTADAAGVVSGVDATTGVVRWQVDTRSLPMRTAVSADGRHVAVLDKSGAARLFSTDTGETVATAPPLGTPVGVAVTGTAASPTLVVADAAGVRGYDSDGRTFKTAVESVAGPVVLDDELVVATSEAGLVALGPDGDVVRSGALAADATDLVASGETIGVLDGSRFTLLDPSFDEIAQADDDADAITTLTGDGTTTFTTTALDGRVTRYSADGTVEAEMQAKLKADLPEVLEDQRAPLTALRAAAVSWGGATWVPTVNGVVRFGGAS